MTAVIEKQSKDLSETTYLVQLMAVLTGVAGFLFGYDNAVISGAVLFIKQEFSLSSTLQEFMVSVHLLGAIVSASFGGVLADRFGRKRTLLLAALMLAMASLSTALATGTLSLMVSRFLVGAGMSVVAITAPLCTAELATKSKRGGLVARYGFGLTIGILAAYGADYLLAADGAWRWMLGLGVVPAVVLTMGVLWVPETPRWLMGVGREDEARAALQRLRQRAAVEEELGEIAGSQQAEGTAKWSDLFEPALRPALVLGIGLAIFRAASGFAVVRFYSPEIFRSAGFAMASNQLAMTVGIGGIMVLTAFLALKLLDRVGRRPLLLGGFTGMAVGMLMLGIVLGDEILPPLVEPWVAVFSVALFTAAFGLGPATAFRPVISEIYPTGVRGLGNSIAQLANSLANLLVAATFLTLLDSIGGGPSFILYGLFAVAAILFVYFCAPETKGHSLEEIEAFWSRDKS